MATRRLPATPIAVTNHCSIITKRIYINISVHLKRWFRNIKSSNVGINKLQLLLECVVTSSKQIVAIAIWF